MKPSDYAIVTTTTDTEENAQSISQHLLQKKLVACIESIHIKSSYRWEGKIISADEIKLEMKTKASLFEHIEKEIHLLHTYEVPEIIMRPIENANSAYLQWIEGETNSDNHGTL